MKSDDIIKILEKLFPAKDGLYWDQNGKNFYFPHDYIKKCLVTLDIDFKTLKYAVDNKVKIIISHHPIKFLDYETEIKDPIKKKMFNIIEKEKIICYSLHTNYDVNKLGMNYQILDKLNAKNIKQVFDTDTVFSGELTKGISMQELIPFFKREIKNLEYIQYVGSLQDLSKKLFICSGSGKSSVPLLPNNTKIFITGELSWHNILYLKERKINTLILGHYMESYFISDISNILKKYLKNVNIIENNIDNMVKFIKM